MFGAFLERSKMSSIFMDLACLLTRNSQGGPAKVAIFASALFGTISGSAAANVYGTGTFTIPLMKKATAPPSPARWKPSPPPAGSSCPRSWGPPPS